MRSICEEQTVKSHPGIDMDYDHIAATSTISFDELPQDVIFHIVQYHSSANLKGRKSLSDPWTSLNIISGESKRYCPGFTYSLQDTLGTGISLFGKILLSKLQTENNKILSYDVMVMSEPYSNRNS